MGVTLTVVVVTMLVALFYPNVTIVFDVLGGFCGSIMALIVPTCMYIKLSGRSVFHWWNALILTIASLLSAVAITSVFIEVAT